MGVWKRCADLSLMEGRGRCAEFLGCGWERWGGEKREKLEVVDGEKERKSCRVSIVQYWLAHCISRTH